MDDRETIERAERVDGLLSELERLPEGSERELATEAVRALVELYGEGLERIGDRLGAARLAELCEDDLVSHLLMVHDLHPTSTEERIEAALETVRPYIHSHGGGVELLGIESGVARLRLGGSCSGCPSSTMTLKLAVEDAIRKHAPEIEAIEAEDGGGGGGGGGPQLLQLENVPARNGGGDGAGDGAADGGDGWAVVGGLPELRSGGALVREVAGEELLFAAVGDDAYAYRPDCPACASSLGGAEVSGAELRCPGCGRAYDLRRAGRCLDSPQLHLEPVPLLVGDEGIARVATGGAA